MPTFYDISLPLINGGLVYPGNPDIRIAPQQEIARGGSSNVSSLSFGSHTGTHVDAPKHMIDDGMTIDQLALDVLMGPAMLVAVADNVMAVGEEQLRLHELKGHTRVLIKTRNSEFIRDREFVRDYTYLAPDGARYTPEDFHQATYLKADIGSFIGYAIPRAQAGNGDVSGEHEYVDAGVQEFMLALWPRFYREPVLRFSTEVIPAFR